MSLWTKRMSQNRVGAAWNVLRGRPTAYRIQITAPEYAGPTIENVSFYCPDAYACLRYSEGSEPVRIFGAGKHIEPPVYTHGFWAR